jgi:hypothetical protein
VRVIAIVLVLGAVPGALWVAGYLPPPNGPDEPAQAVADPGAEEADWQGKVTAICDWERKRVRGLEKAYRHVASPADALLAFDTTIRLGRTSLAIFRRLDPPFEFEREARELERLLEREQRALLALREALRTGKARAFVRQAKKIGEAEERKRALFADLGLRGCLPRAPEGLPEPDISPV